LKAVIFGLTTLKAWNNIPGQLYLDKFLENRAFLEIYEVKYVSANS